jgi:hypothetical protein
MSAADAAHPSTYCYRLLALKSAGAALRVIEPFAKRDLVPLRFESRAGADSLAIEVEVEGLDAAVAQHIARCLAAMVEVERVAMTATVRGLRASA